MRVCPQCGEENPERARFCLACATPLDVEAAARRKLATLLFCDMSGSTAMGEQVDAESVREMMFAYFHEMRGAIERHGGTVEKFIGDAVMAVFGVPTAREDDALRAVRAASEMQERLNVLNDELERRFGARIALRIGVNTGEVVAGDSTSRQTLVTGDAVNVAARLEQAASAGEILLGEQTYRLVRDAVSVEPVAPLALKGKTEPLPAYRLREVFRGARAQGRRLAAPIVGRGAELAVLRDALATVASDRRCVLATVVGEPGVGKSRLAAELVRTVGADARVLSGRCLSYGEGVTYWPVGEIVKEAAGIHDERSKEEAWRRIVTLLAPEERASIIAERVAQAIGLAEGQAAAEEIAWAIRMFFEALAHPRPLLLVFDDIHWAEAALLDLLIQLPRVARSAPILLLCLARRELLEERPDWEATVRLEPLAETESGKLIEHLLGEVALPERLHERIAQAAEGNPLFLEELVATMIEDGWLQRRDGGWVATRDLADVSIPPTLAQLLGARLDRLPDSERSALERGAIEGEIFHRGAVTELSPEPERKELPARLRALEEKEFVRPAQASFADEAAFRFRHILIRDAAYNGTPKRLRAKLHERFADWLEAVSGARVAEVEEILGYHLEQAYRYREELGPVDARSRSLASRAAKRLAAGGHRAFDRADMRAAANLLSRVAELLPAYDRLRLELAPELAEALNFCGELGRGLEVLDDCIEVTRALGDQRLELAALVEQELMRFWSEPEQATAESAIRIADRAIEVFDRAGDDLRLARTHALAASAHFWACRFEAGRKTLERGLVHARRAGARKEESQILTWIARALALGPVPVEEALRHCDEMLAEGALGWLAERGSSEGYVWLLAMGGRFDEARERYASTIAYEEEIGAVWPLTVIRRSAARVEMLAGDWTAAERHLHWSLQKLEAMGEKGQLGTVTGLLAEVVYAQGRYEEAERLTEVAESASSSGDIDAHVKWRCPRGKVLARRGDAAGAIQLAREALSLARRTDALNLQGDALLDLAEVLGLASRVDEATAVIKEGLRTYEEKGNVPSAERARTLLEDL